MITSDVSCRLLEVDFSGIEAVLTGYFLHQHGADLIGAPSYIRLARLGIHAAVTALIEKRPANLTWPDAQLSGYLKEIKAAYPATYECSKRTVHAGNYGQTPYGMVETFPEYFPDLKAAQKFTDYYHTLAPGLPIWHGIIRKQAREHGFLGGPQTLPPAAPSPFAHPYGYRHWYWNVLTYKPCDELTARKWLADPKQRHRIVSMHGRWFQMIFGDDAKRTVAFYPQSTGAGVLKRAELRLFHPESSDYIGDAYFGRTPLLGPVHDSLLLHVPNRIYDRVLEIVVRVMQAPIPELPIPASWGWGDYLRIGVEAKGGRTWAREDMHKLPVPPLVFGVEHPSDPPVIAREDGEAEEWDALGRSVA